MRNFNETYYNKMVELQQLLIARKENLEEYKKSLLPIEVKRSLRKGTILPKNAPPDKKKESMAELNYLNSAIARKRREIATLEKKAIKAGRLMYLPALSRKYQLSPAETDIIRLLYINMFKPFGGNYHFDTIEVTDIIACLADNYYGMARLISCFSETGKLRKHHIITSEEGGRPRFRHRGNDENFLKDVKFFLTESVALCFARSLGLACFPEDIFNDPKINFKEDPAVELKNPSISINDMIMDNIQRAMLEETISKLNIDFWGNKNVTGMFVGPHYAGKKTMASAVAKALSMGVAILDIPIVMSTGKYAAEYLTKLLKSIDHAKRILIVDIPENLNHRNSKMLFEPLLDKLMHFNGKVIFTTPYPLDFNLELKFTHEIKPMDEKTRAQVWRSLFVEQGFTTQRIDKSIYLKLANLALMPGEIKQVLDMYMETHSINGINGIKVNEIIEIANNLNITLLSKERSKENLY